MLKDVLMRLRKINNMTQEMVAIKLNVTRQSVSKWESGLSIPDIYNCQELCKLYNVSIEDLLESDTKDYSFIKPKNKYNFGIVKINDDNTIELSDECLDKMNLKKGDKLVLLGDTNEGIALVPAKAFEEFAKKIIEAIEK